MYWFWKNEKADYVGLCHYRRYFSKGNYGSSLEEKQASILTKNDYEALLEEYDCIVPKKRNYYIETVRSQYEHAHVKSALDTVKQVIDELYPDYSNAFEVVMNRRRLHILNMFVMKKSLFDEYCKWLFTILFEVEKRVDISSYSVYEARIFGFLSERLFNVWLEKQQLNCKEVPVVFLEKQNWAKKITKFLIRKISN